MINKIINCLLVEDNPAEELLLQELLKEEPNQFIRLNRVNTLTDAISALSKTKIDLVLLDLGLPDSVGISTYDRLSQRSNGIPIIVLTGLDDENLAVQALKRGAQDYLIKGKLTSSSLIKSIKYAIVRGSNLNNLLLFRKLSDIAGYGFGLSDLNNNIIYANKSLIEMLGEKSFESLQGKRTEDLYKPDDRKVFRDLILKEAFENNYWVGEIDLIGKDGKIINTIQNVIAIKDEKGSVTCLGNLIINISYLKKIEEQLKEARESYRTIIDSINDAIFIHDINNGAIIDINKKCCDLYGFSREEMLTIDISERCSGIYPHTKEEALKLINQAKDHPQCFEWQAKNKNGAIFWEEVHLICTEICGVPRILATVRDITDRKKAIEDLKENEEMLQSIFRSAPVGIGIVHNRIFGWVNDKLCDIVGYGAIELLGKSARMLYPSDEEFMYVGRVKYEQIQQYGTGSVETKWVRKDGKVIDVLLKSTVLKPNDLSYGVTFTAMDITAQKETEAKLRLSEEKFRAITENSSDITVIVDKEKYFKYISPSVYKVTGYVQEEVLGRKLDDFIPEDDLKNLNAVGDKAFASPDKAHKVDCFRLFKKTGETLYLEGLIVGMPDVAGVNGIVANCRDITKRIEAEKTIKLLSSAAEQTTEGIGVIDLDKNLIYVNQSFAQIHGYSPSELIGKKVDVLHTEKQMPFVIKTIESVDSKGSFSGEVYHARRDGTEFPGFMNVTSLKDNKGNCIGYIGTLFDISERKKYEENFKKILKAVEQSPVSIIIFDSNKIIEYVNPKFIEVSGYSMDELLGKHASFLRARTPWERLQKEVWDIVATGREWRGELCNIKKSGELYWEFATISSIKADDGVITHYLAIKEDITVYKEYERRLIHQANYDNLTDLPNRVLALDRIAQAIIRAQKSNHYVAVMYVDLDRFKIVNDTIGHTVGDKLLIEAAKRLRESARSGDTVARLGGDEFLVVLTEIDELEKITSIAKIILESFSMPFIVEGREVFLTASIGITLFPSDGEDAHILLRNADAAMFKAKEESRNTFQFFTREINNVVSHRIEIEAELRHAQEKKELLLNYQPLVDIDTGKVIGAEALLRWNNRSIGPIFPDKFIPVAEETGLILPIGDWVIKTACSQAKEWQDTFNTPIRICINISSRQFKNYELVKTIFEALDSNSLKPENVELEITENLLLEDAPRTTEIIKELTDKGIRLSVDDFGTGYSALSYLKKYAFNTLKIDRGFVRDVTSDRGDAALAKAIITMAHSLGLQVVGEGVETKGQLEFLRFQGCDYIQGYYFSRPLPAEEFLIFLENHL
ncbi:MAG: PAS domain S-box protein [Candidatus Omnitrophica bacterium]|nr:PAS domain S-box protein [Candidatus Omnitrophota bacterium]